MAKINQDSLMSLEAYAKARPEFRKQAIAHKARRKIFVGDHVMLQFEDEITVRYQIQEMLRIEKTFEEEGIQDELDAYTPLLPDGSNWKATQAIEYSDVEERKLKLVELKGLERHTYIQVGTQDRVADRANLALRVSTPVARIPRGDRVDAAPRTSRSHRGHASLFPSPPRNLRSPPPAVISFSASTEQLRLAPRGPPFAHTPWRASRRSRTSTTPTWATSTTARDTR